MYIIMPLMAMFLGLSLGTFGFTGRAILMWFLAVNGFYTGWMIMYFWRK